jgi:hypothetical protein
VRVFQRKANDSQAMPPLALGKLQISRFGSAVTQTE